LLLAIAFGLGLMAKQSLVTLPCVLLLLDYWPLGRFAGSARRRQTSPRRREGALVRGATLVEPELGRFSFPWHLVIEKLPLLLLAGAACVVTVWAMGQALSVNEHYPLWWRVENGLISYVTYLGHYLFPVGLVVPYLRPGLNLPMWRICEALLVLSGITVAVCVCRRRCPYLLVGWLWYLGMFVPTIGLVQYGAQDVADRYTYLPQIGLCMALAWGAADLCRAWPNRRSAFGVAAALTLISLMGCAWRQTGFWRDSEVLWTHTLACSPQNVVAQSHLGGALATRGQFDEAIGHYREALEIDPAFGLARLSLGDVLLARGRVDAAIAQYQILLKANADSKLAHLGLGNALASRGQMDQAIAHYHRALEIQPDYADAHHNLGVALATSGRFEEAIVHYRQALEIQPDYAEAGYNLGMALAGCGHFDEALTYLQPVMEFRPNDAELQNTFGNILVARGQFQDAVAHYRKALEIQPDHLAAQKSLAWLRATCPIASLRDGDQALKLAQRANRRCDGKRPDVLDALAAAYAEVGWFPEAVATQQKALELATQQHAQSLTDALRARMALYQAEKPFHQPHPASAPPRHKP
jgi:tetratricopeptide (TPR) repeat protein